MLLREMARAVPPRGAKRTLMGAPATALLLLAVCWPQRAEAQQCHESLIAWPATQCTLPCPDPRGVDCSVEGDFTVVRTTKTDAILEIYCID
jgi:hypothetical protein